MVKGIHLTPEGAVYIKALRSGMNNARLSSNLNNPKFKKLPIPLYDPLKLPPVYTLTEDFLIKDIKTGNIVTKPKFYSLENVEVSGDLLYFKSLQDIANFLKRGKTTILTHIKNNTVISSSISGKSFYIKKYY